MRAGEGGEQVTHLGRGNKECKDSGAGAGLRLELNGQGAEWCQVMSDFLNHRKESVPHASATGNRHGNGHGNGHLITGMGMISDYDVGDSGGKKVRLCINPSNQ